MEVNRLLDCAATLGALAERMNQALPLTEQSVQTASALAIAQAIVLKYASYIQCGLSPDEALGPTAKESMRTTRRN